jgi:hypothetical protein
MDFAVNASPDFPFDLGMRTPLVSLLLVIALPGLASAGDVVLTEPMPTAAQCLALGPVRSPLPFRPGETLEFDVDALGVKAGSMDMRVLPPRDGRWPVSVTVKSNTFFSKIRKVEGLATSTIDPATARPVRYLEDATEDTEHRVADVLFDARRHVARLVSTINGSSQTLDLPWGTDISDVASTVYLLRAVPMKEGQRLCFDAYGLRRIWRVWGTVLKREHVSMALGEFEAFHLAGQAARLDLPAARREVHVWVSDDAKRLPLAALGTIDLGSVRATLKRASRPGEKALAADNKADLTW